MLQNTGKARQELSLKFSLHTERLKRVLARWWRKFIVDECPEAREERIRRERIGNIMQSVALLEAFRLLEIEHRKDRAR